MALNATPKNFVMKEVFEMLLQDPTTNKPIAYLTNLKNSTVTNEVTMVYPQGGRGNVYIGRGFAHSHHFGIEATSATFNSDLLAAQNGTAVAHGETVYTHYVQLDLVNNGTAYELPFNPIKETGADKYIGYIYATQSNGDYAELLTEDEAAAEGEGTATFTVTPATESAKAKITLASGTSTRLIGAGNIKLTMAYKAKSTSAAQKITIDSTSLPKTANVTAYGMANDSCDGKDYPMIVRGYAQIDGNWSFELAADGDPSVQNISLQFLRSCTSGDLADIIIDKDEE